MNLILTIFLVADPLWTASAAIPALAWVQEKSLVEELGNAVRDAFKALTAKPAPPAVIRVPVVNASEKEKQERRSRLQAYGNSMRVWLEPTCDLDEGQRDKLQNMLTKELGDESRWRAREVQANQQLMGMGNQFLGVCFPIIFTRSNDGFATEFQAGMKKSVSAELLAEEGRQRLQAAIAERIEFHNNTFRDYIISILDRELYLTREQRAKLVADITSRVKFDHGMYSFLPQSYYLPYRSITDVVNASNSAFGDEQRQRFRDLCSASGNREQHVLFQSSDGVETWYQQVEDAGVAQRDILLRLVAVRIAYYKAEMHVPSEQSAHLLLAGKGAAELALIDWKESTRLTVDQMQQHVAVQRGNFAFAASKVSANDLERQPVWSDSVNAILSNQDAKWADARDKANHLARANAVLAMLDQELWLRPEQRQPLLELIENAFPRRSTRTTTESQDYFREIALLAQPLFKIPDEKINTVLNESQQAVWKQLKSYFRLQPGSNYLLVPTKNGNFGVQLYD